MAGPAGFEPATPGFGVRCSPVRATDLYFSCIYIYKINFIWSLYAPYVSYKTCSTFLKKFFLKCFFYSYIYYNYDYHILYKLILSFASLFAPYNSEEINEI